MSRKRGRSDDDDVEEEDSPSRFFQGPVLDPPYTPPPIPPLTAGRRQRILEREHRLRRREDVSMGRELQDIATSPSLTELREHFDRWAYSLTPEQLDQIATNNFNFSQIWNQWLFSPGMERVNQYRDSRLVESFILYEGRRRLRKLHQYTHFQSDHENNAI
jgi:hypothetical protein